MKINCIIIDDEPLAAQATNTLLNKVPFIKVIRAFDSSVEALQYINSENIDLIFLDINMPDLTGIELIKKITNENVLVIFTTAYSNFALEGFDLGVVDYLLKPYSFERILEACCKAQERLILKKSYLKRSSTTNTDSDLDFIFVKSEYNLIKIDVKNILFIEGLKDYVKIYSSDLEKPVLTLQSLKAFEVKLPRAYFFRIQKSFIVNVKKISLIQRNYVVINNREIPIGIQYKDALLEFVANSMPK